MKNWSAGGNHVEFPPYSKKEYSICAAATAMRRYKSP